MLNYSLKYFSLDVSCMCQCFDKLCDALFEHTLRSLSLWNMCMKYIPYVIYIFNILLYVYNLMLLSCDQNSDGFVHLKIIKRRRESLFNISIFNQILKIIIFLFHLMSEITSFMIIFTLKFLSLTDIGGRWVLHFQVVIYGA